jgi:hypothetical protein
VVVFKLNVRFLVKSPALGGPSATAARAAAGELELTAIQAAVVVVGSAAVSFSHDQTLALAGMVLWLF